MSSVHKSKGTRYLHLLNNDPADIHCDKRVIEDGEMWGRYILNRSFLLLFVAAFFFSPLNFVTFF